MDFADIANIIFLQKNENKNKINKKKWPFDLSTDWRPSDLQKYFIKILSFKNVSKKIQSYKKLLVSFVQINILIIKSLEEYSWKIFLKSSISHKVYEKIF